MSCSECCIWRIMRQLNLAYQRNLFKKCALTYYLLCFLPTVYNYIMLLYTKEIKIVIITS